MKMTPWRYVLGIALCALCLAGRPAQAQTSDEPSIALRPFVLVTDQAFAATDTLEAAFDRAVQPFYGGGLETVWKGFYGDLAGSRFKKAGQRAFRVNNQTFRLGLPLNVTITPFELTFGYRLGMSRRIVPFGGGGAGSYRYQETSEFSDPAENLDTRRTGYLAVGGVEFRALRWLRVSVDAQYTHVSGILGSGGVSKAVGENDLGGTAARLKFIVGR